jgi:hypothetical protein
MITIVKYACFNLEEIQGHTSKNSLKQKTPVMALELEIVIKAHRNLYTPWTGPEICNEIAEVRYAIQIVSVHEKG